MDINAGRYLDGEPFEALTAESFELLLATASGQRSKGEAAGHSQTSLWRNWRQTDASHVAEIRARPAPDGQPLKVGWDRWARLHDVDGGDAPLHLFRNDDRFATERIGLVLPTSMCSAQIARLAADRMNAGGLADRLGFSRFVALTHSEGCGFGGESMYHLLYRTYRGYATHPNVAATLLLEHGCEKIPNDVMRRQFEQAGIPVDRFGWVSVQLDGGIDRALAKVEDWFTATAPTLASSSRVPVSFGALTLGFLSAPPVGATGSATLAQLARRILVDGGSVLLPESDPLLASPTFREIVLGDTTPHATLAYGQPFTVPGLHIVATDSDHWVENLTALGACGAHGFVGLVGTSSQQSHPMLPLIQLTESAFPGAVTDVDLVLTGDETADDLALSAILRATFQGENAPAANRGGFVDFQLSRGLLGVST
jgi:altronate dehydratase